MKTPSWSTTLRTILFSTLIGGAAGVLAAAVTSSSLLDYALELGDRTQPAGISQTRPRTLPETYEQALARLEEVALPGVGTLYRRGTVGETGVAASQADATVMAMTSDGWLLSSIGGVGDTVSFGTHTCKVDETMEEPLYGFTFLHCPLSSLLVVDIGSGYAARAGDQVFIVSSEDDLVFSHVRSVVWAGSVGRSDIPSRRLQLAVTQDLRTGSAVFNVYGELIGIVQVGDGGFYAVPFEHLSGAFEQVLESSESITYPSLGVIGINLGQVIGVDEEIAQGRDAGFLLYGPGSVTFGSVAQEAGFAPSDLILSVDGTKVDSTQTLDDLISLYRADDEVRIEFEREGMIQEVTLTLGERPL